jgi:hypothetical protein
MDLIYGIALSFHLGFEQHYNSIHPHIRLQDDSFIAGAYYNSEDALSAYAGVQITRSKWNHEFGVVSGYGNYKVLPFIRTTYDFNDNVIGYITPGFENNNVGIVFGIELQNSK